jgi:hypothetical protein
MRRVSQPPGWGTPPDPSDPSERWQRPPDPSQRLPDGNAGQPMHWGDYTPPPGWQPPPQKRIKARQIFAGIGAWFLVNGVLLLLANTGAGAAGGFGSLVVLGVNIAMIVVPAVKGHKGFAVGFALGYVVALILFLGACFILLAQFDRSYGR